MDALAAASRVRAFVEARTVFRSRLIEDKNPFPNRIIAEYGYLDMDDLMTLCDAVQRQENR